MVKISHPLKNSKIFENLITFETDIMTEACTNLTLQKIIEIYTNLVEYYESKKDPIYLYFKEKIDILLHSKVA